MNTTAHCHTGNCVSLSPRPQHQQTGDTKQQADKKLVTGDHNEFNFKQKPPALCLLPAVQMKKIGQETTVRCEDMTIFLLCLNCDEKVVELSQSFT